MQIPVEEEGLHTKQGHNGGLEKEPPTHTPKVRGEPRRPDADNQKGILESLPWSRSLYERLPLVPVLPFSCFSQAI